MRRILVVLAVLVAWAGAARAETAVLAGGCFWCVEANFEGVPGVRDVVSGYAGGTTAKPTYKNHKGYYEAVQITFDPARISYGRILDLFLHSTDVLDAGGQFCDRGPAYRSAIFAKGAQQTAEAEAAVARAEAELGRRIVTPVLPAGKFWPAEDYHQDYASGQNIVITRSGPMKQANAYKFYRDACGRDRRVEALWGSRAEFLH